jgi:GTP-binding protein HflX
LHTPSRTVYIGNSSHRPRSRPIPHAFESDRDQFTVTRERAILVSVSLPDRPWTSDDPCDEIRGLVETAGAVVVGELTQKRQDIQLGTYIGTGKLQELKELADATDADVVCFDNDLGPAQARNLEKALGVKVLDRSEVILDIFAGRARTPESRLQVELAQLEYSLPRLKNMWTHLSRQAGGGIGLRGPGETQLEVDRRIADTRIRDLKRRLAEVQARKEREVRSRGGEMTVSLVGYTNAGKSRLMNTLTGAGVYVENKLFSTLDTRTRQWPIPDFGKVLLSDTVGFIRDLPHHLVASFKATLEEARQARLLLHVVDSSNPHAEEHIAAVNAVLTELGVADKPTILVLNKIDRLADRDPLAVLRAHHPKAVAVSGLTGEGLDELRAAVVAELSAHFVPVEVTLDAGNGKALAYLNAHAEIFRQEFRGNQVVIRCHIAKALLHHVQTPDATVRFLDPAGDAKAG